MPFFKFNKNNFSGVLKKYFSFKNDTRSLKPLSEILESFRREDFEVVLAYLKENQLITENLGYYIRNIFDKKPFIYSLTEANILSENAFLPELKKRVLNSILPPVDYENTVWHIVDSVTIRPSKDLAYFENIRSEDLDELFRLLQITDFIRKPSVINNLIFSMDILAWRAIGNALDAEVMKMAPRYRNYANPFLALQGEFDGLNADYKQNSELFFDSKNQRYKQIKIYLHQCLEFVETAFKNSSRYGISGKINQALLKIRQQIMRISEILELLVIDDEKEVLKNSKLLFFNILNYKSHKNNLKELVNDSTRLISHLITNHTAETGTQYITSSFKDYMKMFWKASGGGAIVGALCVLKMLCGYLPGSEFSHAFMFSLNYAMGFIIIYLMGFTLATKQPAMTAATMAKVLSDEENTQKNYVDFAHLVSKLFRSQFIAFVGNVLWSFPVALAIIYGLDALFGKNMVTPEKAEHLLNDLDPVHSKALFHASIAGVYLFISGIIAGNVGNNSVFYQIPKRIANNTFIIKIFGEKFARSLSVFYSKKWAGIVSNFWFGVFLGVTGTIGKFLGLDIDIRHITFAAGNFALGLYGNHFSITGSVFWICFVTVFLIGFFNFSVSFGLSMILAFRSRKVTMGEVGEIVKEIFNYFFKNPLRFFFPIRSFLDSRAKEMVDKTIGTKS
jgi:site-specific recombinase